MSTNFRLKGLAISLIFLLAIPIVVNAQTITSSIKGNVLDSAGNVVAGASVQVVDLRNGATRTYTTNNAGAFLAARLAVGGPYQVTVNDTKTVTVDSLDVGEIYNLTINLQQAAAIEEVVVVGEAATFVNVAAGPAATFSQYDLVNAVAFDRDIQETYSIDPRVYADLGDRGSAINCAGKHPRFNSLTLDGVGLNDRFGLNNNGYATATGQPFPYDAIEQVAVELAPFDVTYGGFSACNINAVTKAGSNEWEGGAWWEWNNEDLRGDSLSDRGETQKIESGAFDNRRRGFKLGGPIIKDQLFFYATYEEEERPNFLAMGYNGSNNGDERPWLSEEDFNRIQDISRNIYGYDPGGLPQDATRENEKWLVRADWNINDNHTLTGVYNYNDGFQINASDNDSNEFEFPNHFYTKGAELTSWNLRLNSQWTDSFSTAIFYNDNEMNDSQVTVGPKEFGDHQISLPGRNTVYLGADDSRQANDLNWNSKFYKFIGQWLAGDHVITAGYEREELTVFNIFVQHSRGGEYDYFDDSGSNPAFCADLGAQGRLDNPDCRLSGIDKFELGLPDRLYYGSAGGTNNALDAAANFQNNKNSVYIQDEWLWAEYDVSFVFGLRYDWFDSDDRPNFNAAVSEATGIRNDANIDGLDILQPRIGFTWTAREDLTVRGGIGLFSGGNPNVWLSNAWSNDGITNVQTLLNNFGARSWFGDDPLQLIGEMRPGFDPTQEQFDEVAAAGPDSGSISNVVLLDPNYEQPSDWKFALGATWDMPWYDIVMDVDYLYSRGEDQALYQDVSQVRVGQTVAGAPLYEFCDGCGENNLMLTNSDENPETHVISLIFNKSFDNGLDAMFGYAYTDAEDVSPMTSFTAGSSYESVATNDPNFPTPATSNWEVPNRFTLRLTYGRAFFSDLESRFTLYGIHEEGEPQSFVMDGGEPTDPFFGRHLLYVPTGADDPAVVFAPGFDQAEFFAWADSQGLARGQFVERNSHHAGWTTRMDFLFTQEIFSGLWNTRGKIFFKIYNLTNLLNDSWGKVEQGQFFPLQVVSNDINDDGQYVFQSFDPQFVGEINEQRSLWEARIGFEVNF